MSSHFQYNIPWEDRQPGDKSVVWRYSKNPIIPRNLISTSNSIFNSAVIPFQKAFAGVFRCDDTCRRMNIHRGISKDGINWDIDPEPIQFINPFPDFPESIYKYDPRIVSIEGRYYITWCNGYHGPGIGLGYTDDFEKFYQMEPVFMPFNRNGVLFPRKIGGNYAILSRPSDNGHTSFGDIFYSQSPDLIYWGKHRHVMGTQQWNSAWQSTKIGAGPIPVETNEGWLVFYHGVITSCNGFVYSMGAAILDLDQPYRVIYRTKPYLLSPQMPYECVGDVPNVVFPCSALYDSESERIAIYYGAADTTTALAFSKITEVMEFIKENNLNS
jgi:beta-1,4-mannooligosaccharide/beta-1,4-mannosyl-N-acetylglucosamine phosphorylase